MAGPSLPVAPLLDRIARGSLADLQRIARDLLSLSPADIMADLTQGAARGGGTAQGACGTHGETPARGASAAAGRSATDDRMLERPPIGIVESLRDGAEATVGPMTAQRDAPGVGSDVGGHLASPLSATVAAAEAAFAVICPHLVDAARDGIRAAARAAAAVVVHFRIGDTSAVAEDADSDGGAQERGGRVADSPFATAHDRAVEPTASPARHVGGARRPAAARPGRGGLRGAAVRSGGVPRAHVTMRHRLMIICLRSAGMTFSQVQKELPISMCPRAIRNTWYRRERYLAAMRLDSVDLSSARFRSALHPALDAALLSWFLAVRACGRRTVPVTVELLKGRAKEIAEEMGLTDFRASTGFVCRWAKRHHVRSIALVGAAASADRSGTVAEMDALRQVLRGVEPRLIYNMDETGLFYRCLPYRSYVTARERRTARGSKAMRAKDRVTAVLCVNADGSHKLPIAVIGKAARPLCFRPPAAPCPVPYFSQTNAWMDGPTMAAWFRTVFVAEVRRVTTEPVYLIMDNAPSHGVLREDGVTVLCLPPNTTSIYQPLDMGIISAVKRRYKSRLLRKVLQELRSQLAAGAPREGNNGTAGCGSTGPAGCRTIGEAGSGTVGAAAGGGAAEATPGGAAPGAAGGSTVGAARSNAAGTAGSSAAGAAGGSTAEAPGADAAVAATAAAAWTAAAAATATARAATATAAGGGSALAAGRGASGESFGGASGVVGAGEAAGAGSVAARGTGGATAVASGGAAARAVGGAAAWAPGGANAGAPGGAAPGAACGAAAVAAGRGAAGPASGGAARSRSGAHGPGPALRPDAVNASGVRPSAAFETAEWAALRALTPSRAPTALFSPSSASGNEAPSLGRSPSSALHPLRLPLISGLPFHFNLSTMPQPPPRRTFVGPFSPRQPPAASVAGADDEPEADDGTGLHTITLKDACTMLRTEWGAVTEATICNCWIKADVLLPEANATLRSRHSSYHTGTLRVDEEVGDILQMVQAWTCSAEPTTPSQVAERVISVSEWLEAEQLPPTVLDTVANMPRELENEGDESEP